MSLVLNLELPDEAASIRFGQNLGKALQWPLVVFLQGPLGAGKTTVARALIQQLGHPGSVKSPTYGLLEEYRVDGGRVMHLDLYRINEAAELSFLALDDLLEGAVTLVEWPDHGQGGLPPADLHLVLTDTRPGRQVELRAGTPAGEAVVERLSRTG